MNLFKISTYLYNKRLFNDIKVALKIQFESAEKIEAIKKEKFIKLVKHAEKNVPYYKGKLSNINNVNDISKIEFLTKENIRNNNNELKATNLSKKRFIPVATSGSTGESLYLYSDAESFYKKAVTVRGNGWAGQKYGEKELLFWGAERDINENKSFYKKIKHRYVLKNKILSTYHLSNDDIKNYIKIYNNYKPSVIVAYPSPLFHIANYIEENKIKVLRPKGIITSAETLFFFQREKIEKVFDSKVFNRYGCREVGHIAAECESHDGLHINTDRFVLEIVDSNGSLCKPGELGEIVITDLDNYVFPLIRYKIGDLGILSKKTNCSCGRNLPLLEKVEGRVFDLIVGINGNIVGGTFWTLLKHKIKGWGKFQIIQEKQDFLEIIIEDNIEIENDFSKKLTRIIKNKLGENMNINIKIIDKIPLTKTGKHRWITSKISPYVQ